MNLIQLLSSNPSLAELQGLALILSPGINAALESVQAEHRHLRLLVRALELADGRFMLKADLLAEVAPGKFYAEGFGALPEEILPLVDVVPMSEALALLPEPEGEP